MNKMLLGLVLCLASAVASAGQILGAALDADNGGVVVFSDLVPWPECTGGAAYKGKVAGCWVSIEGEDAFFVMWKDGTMSTVYTADVVICDSFDTCEAALRP